MSQELVKEDYADRVHLEELMLPADDAVGANSSFGSNCNTPKSVSASFKTLAISDEVNNYELDVTELQPVERWLNPEFPSGMAGKDVSVILTHVDDLGQMYVHLEENNPKMRQMQDFFSSYYGNPKEDFLEITQNLKHT